MIKSTRVLLTLSTLSLLAACGTTDASGDPAPPGAAGDAAPAAPAPDSVYALSAMTLGGESVDLARYEGKVTLFVNVASRCGYTPQYAGLQKLHEELGGEGFAIVGVPSNDFGGQEPGSPSQIQAFCQENYGVTFDMLAKQGTKDGDSALFDRLAELSGERPGWNFCKFVVGPDGRSARFFSSRVAPDSPELAAAIQELGS
ncbi:MAG: glutathione peroxidase [Planctomycetota bacterium]|nr:glutathione peroxidase [Planctomycetota bacterium]MEC8510934.1 glutathione peroxidase [Planctomycetota bacterium]MEE2939160.1 glutathione peroxidase [Planctomycetota bacterium]